ncbi:MAG: undecaprenyl-diphosphatase UppP [Ignavibacteriae bacterium]|nr:undecaprenyl-diphosphatase UppP [Ignavibacteriota bacterium]
MSLFEAIVLGIVQGLTEFLPISSSAHLTLTGRLFGLINPETSESWTAFMAVMQIGTLGAVVVYFFKDLTTMTQSLWNDVRSYRTHGKATTYSFPSKLAFFIVLGTIPMAIIGVLFSKAIHSMLTKSTTVIASSLIGLALLLWLAEKIATHKKPLEKISWLDALIIGAAQAMALIPGSSRSGTTLTAGLFVNLTREAAARFSFLLSIPAVAASGVYELSKVHGGIGGFGIGNLVAATVVSGIVGYAAIAWLLKFLATNTTFSFIVYRIALGILLLVLVGQGFVQF